MFRWHEPGCKKPEVTAESGMPFCRYCYALAPPDTERSRQTAANVWAPRLGPSSRWDLKWPSAVNYTTVAQRPRTIDNDDKPEPAVSSALETTEPSAVPVSSYAESCFPPLSFDDEIRLLRLKPGGPDDPICGDLKLANLENSTTPVYDAASYTWADEAGDSSRSCAVYIGAYWDMVYVAPGCERALKRLRHRKNDRLLWVDALCIDLESIKERDDHVALVRTIYTKAARAVAYLGEASADSVIALAFIKDLRTENLISGQTSTPNTEQRKALASLFGRHFFSRLWIMVETVFAREVNIVCGQDSAVWPNLPLANVLTDINAPGWFTQRFEWRDKLSRASLTELMVHASALCCSDPRDKVFGVLTFTGTEHISSDYSLAVEKVYTGIAAYLIKAQKAFDILLLTGSHERQYGMPSWVPDWSQKLVSSLPKEKDFKHEDFDMKNAETELSNPITFRGPFRTAADDDLQIDSFTGSLHLYAFRLLELTGRKLHVDGQTKIIMDRGRRGSLIVTVKDAAYEPRVDSVFLLHGWDQPVILRSQPGVESYTFVSACALAVGTTSGSCFLPWSDTAKEVGDHIQAIRFSPEEIGHITQFHATLVELCNVQTKAENNPASDDSAKETLMVLDYSLLSLTRLREIESRLMDHWNRLEQQLGWLFLDQIAIWKFIRGLDQVEEGRQYQGSSQMQIEPNEYVGFASFGGAELQQNISWDVRQFCSTFLRRTTTNVAAFPDSWTPILSQMQSFLPQMQQWASLTEQLLKLVEYSSSVLGRSWPSIPGDELPAKWRACWTDCGSVLEQKEFSGSTATEASTWDWSEFKAVMILRERLWRQTLPQQLDPSVNHKLAVQLGFRAIGLNLVLGKPISIA